MLEEFGGCLVRARRPLLSEVGGSWVWLLGANYWSAAAFMNAGIELDRLKCQHTNGIQSLGTRPPTSLPFSQIRIEIETMSSPTKSDLLLGNHSNPTRSNINISSIAAMWCDCDAMTPHLDSINHWQWLLKNHFFSPFFFSSFSCVCGYVFVCFPLSTKRIGCLHWICDMHCRKIWKDLK